MEKILATSPLAVLYLDQDAYIKTDLPLSIKHLKDHQQSRYIQMNEYQPHASSTLKDQSFTMYDRLQGVVDVYQTMPMPILQTLFEDHAAFSRRMHKTELFSTGGGWLELGHPKDSAATQHTRFFLHQWWAEGRNFEGGYQLNCAPWQEKVLGHAMGTRPDVRAHTALLEDRTYGGPDSECIPHLYAEYKRVPEYVGVAMSTLVSKSLIYLDKLPATIKTHTEYEMMPIKGS